MPVIRAAWLVVGTMKRTLFALAACSEVIIVGCGLEDMFDSSCSDFATQGCIGGFVAYCAPAHPAAGTWVELTCSSNAECPGGRCEGNRCTC